jgi:hypothetical protein
MKEIFNPVFLDIAKRDMIMTVWPCKLNGNNTDTAKCIRNKICGMIPMR